LPLPSGSPQRIGDFEVSWAAWSPDGDSLVFSKGSDLYICDAEGNRKQKLASFTLGFPYWAYFSPDGHRIRFTLDNRQNSTHSLWEVRTDGSDLHQLLAGWRNEPDECCGRWTQDGRYYLFESYHRRWDIFALPEQTLLRRIAKPVQITFGPIGFSSPLVSVDQKKLFAYGLQSRGELVHYDKISRRFAPLLGGSSASHAAFSRDGKWVTYVSLADQTLWRSRVDGSEKLQLTFTKGTFPILPAWSPDGKQIAFVPVESGKPLRIFLISADGGSPRAVTSGESQDSDPTWSLDGSQLAFGSASAAGAPSASHITIMDMKSGTASMVPGSEGLFSPRWSPDGRFLLALPVQDNHQKLLLYDFNTQKWTTLLTDHDGISYPSWTNDSQYVNYESGGGDHPEFRRIHLGASKSEKLFSLNDVHMYENWAFWSTVAPDNSVVFTRDVSTHEIYALDLELP
jgi:Tol biopolymer transport system component